MSKRVFIVHRWDGSPSKDWIPWLKLELEARGFIVSAPQMPQPEAPSIHEWVGHLRFLVDAPDRQTFFVGHSIGCQTILRYLQDLPKNIEVGGVLMVAPWVHLNMAAYKDENDIDTAEEWLQDTIMWNRIPPHTKNITAIFSDDDPYVPALDQKLFEEKLGAQTIIEHKKGHIDQDAGVVKLQRILSEATRLARSGKTL